MYRKLHKRYRKLHKSSVLSLSATLVAIAVLLLTGGCANIGSPSGGPRDEDPPRFVSSNPAPGSLNVDKTKIVLTFNELVNVKDAFSKVVVSPTAKSVPRVSSQGKRVTVEFDSLAANTTYTVDFADAIEDNNESNKLQGFTYSFSTGDHIDTLRIAGRVLSARALEPQKGMLVGIHSNLSDTAFTTTRLLRVAKTDDRGRFVVRGLAPGSYRVFALGDKDNDYTYSTPEEDVAFYDFVVTPSSQQVSAVDTLYDKKTGAIDTIVTRQRTQFLPNDIVLRSFNSELRQQFLAKYERLDSTRVFLKFNARADSLPRVRVIDRPDIRSLGTLEASHRLDSLVWWLSPELVRTDSLRLEVSYTRSDQNLVKTPVVDTLDFFTRRPPKPKASKRAKPQKISAADSIAAITTRLRVISGTSQDVHLPVLFETPVPFERFDSTAVRLSVMVDTLYQPVPEHFILARADSLNPRGFSIDYPWEYGTKYRLEIDSLAATDIYGKPTVPLRHDFTIKQEGDYCSLLMHISGVPAGMPAFVELLNGSDAVQHTASVKTGDAFFPFLTPGKYYARIIFDTNGNGEYDTGNYQLGLQPEVAYYYPKAINIKKNWDKEENWALFDLPVDMMKPAAVLKNKPDQEARNRARQNKKDAGDQLDDEEDDYFDPTANPFDPNQKKARQRNRTAGGY